MRTRMGVGGAGARERGGTGRLAAAGAAASDVRGAGGRGAARRRRGEGGDARAGGDEGALEVPPGWGARRRAGRRRAARGEKGSRAAARERDERRLEALSEQRIEMIENILRNKYFGEGGRGFGGTGADGLGDEDLDDEGDDEDAPLLSLAETEAMLQAQRGRVHGAASSSRAPLGGKKLLRLGYPLMFLGGLPKRFDSERWLREFLAERERAFGEPEEGGLVVRADPVVVSPEEYRHTARLSRGRSAPCRGYAIVAVANEAGAGRFVERYDNLSAVVAGRQCRLTARPALRSELLRLKRHPTMKGLVMTPFVPERRGRAAGGGGEEAADALAAALDFERLVPGDAEDVRNAIRSISEDALRTGKWTRE